MVEAGHVALWVAVVGSALTVLTGVGWRGRHRLVRVLAVVSATAAALAVVALAWAFWRHDFSVVYVADHSRRGLGTWDRVSGVWGGMDGSLLLFGALVAVLGVAGARSTRATCVASGTAGALLATDLWLANPFDRLAIPAIDGSGLTPILEHPAMRIHPPLVYLGLCALVVPFALALGGPGSRKVPDTFRDAQASWWRPARQWLLASWTLLGLGMVIGSWWAYAELGWGGYWAWDPVENTALVPWLAVTVALHTRPGNPPGRGAVVAAALPFPLAIMGAVLTRSGATGSVHAFAEAEAVGRALLALLVGIAVATVMAATTSRPTHQVGRDGAWWWRVAVGLMATVTAIVAFGTLFPIVRSWLGGDRSLVAGAWFSAMTWPAAVAGLWLLVIARAPRGLIDGRRWWLTRVAVGAITVLVAGGAGWPASGLVLVGSATVALVAVAPDVRRPSGLAHLGLAVLLIGVAGTSSGHHVSDAFTVGERFTVGGHDIELRGLDVEDGPVPGSSAVVATVTVDGHTLRPSLVAYPQRRVLLAETSLRSTPASDVQVVLRNAGDDGTAVLIVHVNPLQQLIWLGALLIVVGGMSAFIGRVGPDDGGVGTRGASPGSPMASAPPWVDDRDRPVPVVVPDGEAGRPEAPVLRDPDSGPPPAAAERGGEGD